MFDQMVKTYPQWVQGSVAASIHQSKHSGQLRGIKLFVLYTPWSLFGRGGKWGLNFFPA